MVLEQINITTDAFPAMRDSKFLLLTTAHIRKIQGAFMLSLFHTDCTGGAMTGLTVSVVVIPYIQ